MTRNAVRSEIVVVLLALVLIASSLGLVSRPMPIQAQESEPAAPYLDRVAAAEGATYHARQLVVLFGARRSAAVVDVHSSPGATFVRAEAGADVTRLWRRPGRGIIAAPDEALRDDAPPSVPLRTGEILNKYEVSVGEPESILGVDVVPLTLVRRSDRVRVERLWVHEGSGVVYRRELYGEDGRLVGMSTVLDMWWGDDATIEPFDEASEPPSRVDPAIAPDAPRRLPNGYRLVNASRFHAGGRPADHWVYSDGLHALSVFRMSGAMRAPAEFRPSAVAGSSAWVGPGPGTWAWEGDGTSWVLVAEEPALDPEEMTSGLPRGGRSAWARMGSLWARGFHWVGSLFT